MVRPIWATSSVVGQAGAVVIALVVNEYLGLIFQAAEGGGVQDAVTVALESGAVIRLFLRVAAPLGIFAADAVWRQALVFEIFQFFTCKVHIPAYERIYWT